MKTVNLIEADFESTISKEGIVLIDFWAPWCAPCRAFAPIFEKSAAAHPDVTFAKVNTEEQQDLSAALGIVSIPTVMAFRDGVLLFAQPGMLPEKALEEIIKRIGELDMQEVRRQVERETVEPAVATA